MMSQKGKTAAYVKSHCAVAILEADLRDIEEAESLPLCQLAECSYRVM